MKAILNGIIKENPIFVLMLGLCPVLAVTTKFETAYIMGICVLVILLFSSLTISMIKKIIPDNVKIPVFVLIVATFVAIIEMLFNKYVPVLHEALGIYLPLVAVNCIVIGRALSVASKEKIGRSLLDALGIGLGFLLALILIALIREGLGSNTITIMDTLSSLTGYKAIYNLNVDLNIFPIRLLTTPAGAFLVIGILIALFRKGNESDESI